MFLNKHRNFLIASTAVLLVLSLLSIPQRINRAFANTRDHQQLVHVPSDLVHADRDNYKWVTEARLRQLAACSATGTCSKNADHVVIMGAWHCHIAVFEGYQGGEGIWCLAMIESFERQGFTVLHARDDWAYIDHIHRQIPDLVKVIIATGDGSSGRAEDYYKTDGRLHGIPAWKHFYFSYFPTIGVSVVGDRWCVCAEPHKVWNYTFTGYSLEPPASKTHVVPFEERPHRAYILAKRVQLFYQYAMPMWDTDYFARAAEHFSAVWPDFEFVGGFVDDRTEEDRISQGPMPAPKGVKNLGKLDAERFDEEVGKARVLVGIGWPALSPSPYRALARGVPFINPHQMDERSKADQPNTWRNVQHATLKEIDEPLIYQVEAFNYSDFERAIKTAMETPIKPFRFDWHSRSAFDKRTHNLMTTDWRTEAEIVLEDRLAGKETQWGGKAGVFAL